MPPEDHEVSFSCDNMDPEVVGVKWVNVLFQFTDDYRSTMFQSSSHRSYLAKVYNTEILAFGVISGQSVQDIRGVKNIQVKRSPVKCPVNINSSDPTTY